MKTSVPVRNVECHFGHTETSLFLCPLRIGNYWNIGEKFQQRFMNFRIEKDWVFQKHMECFPLQ